MFYLVELVTVRKNLIIFKFIYYYILAHKYVDIININLNVKNAQTL